MRSEALETTGPDGLRLRVEFVWQVDRYRHIISAVEPRGRSIPLLESVEGALSDEWPPSPPLQSLHVETQQGGRRVALLVGMAGKSHWSASIGPLSNGTGLVFDLACRAGGSPRQIGTSYRFADGVRVALADANFVRLHTSDCVLVVEASNDQATRSELKIHENSRLSIQPQKPGSSVQPTRRWLYHVQVNVA
jgi:hypothetical protein